MSPELIFEAMRHLVDEVVYVNDVDRNIVFVTPSVEHVLGYDEAQFMRHRTVELIHPEDLPAAAEASEDLRKERGGSYRVTLRVRHASGRWVWCEILGRNLLDKPIAGIVNTLRDVSERRALEEELHRQATHDDLTELRNRRGFLAALSEALAAPGDPHVAMLMLDLDGFKAVNDAHGHSAGDALLVQVARRIERALRPGDVAARLGGDEFAILCHRVTDTKMLESIAERVLREITGAYALASGSMRIGCSLGAARSVADDEPDALLRIADVGLYAAKADGESRARIMERDTDPA